MRIFTFLKTIFSPAYAAILLLIFLLQSYDNQPKPDGTDLGGHFPGELRSMAGGEWRDEGESIGEKAMAVGDDEDLADDLSIYGFPRRKILPISKSKLRRKTTILMWTDGEIGPGHLGGCPDYNCEITSDQGMLSVSDAVVFNMGIGQPEYRDPSQFYVFFTQESPMHSAVLGDQGNNFFNLSLGFRRDSDIPCPYGYVVKRKSPLERLPPDVIKLIKRKDRSIAWFVSNCGAPSGRDEYVKELRKYMNVDIYGACGTLMCPKDTGKCNELLERRYKFYLAFENSLCKDYTTEKFWEKMTLNIITIVLKRSVVATQAPPDSFIAADDFQSPRALAEYLMQLEKNEELYLKHFQWRLQYRPVFLNGREHDRRERPWCFCRLCLRLKERPIRHNGYSNFDDWWSKEAACDGELVGQLLGVGQANQTAAPSHNNSKQLGE